MGNGSGTWNVDNATQLNSRSGNKDSDLAQRKQERVAQRRVDGGEEAFDFDYYHKYIRPDGYVLQPGAKLPEERAPEVREGGVSELERQRQQVDTLMARKR